MSPAVAAEWERCRAWILPALQHDTEEHLIEELAAGRAQIWGAADAALITQLVNAEEPALHIWLAGGNLHSILALQPGLEAWGRAQGAKGLWLNGRKGWARVLSKTGFEVVGEELRRAL